MPDVAGALRDGLERPDIPGTGPDLVKFAGGRRALTEQLSGMSGPPKVSEYGPRDSEGFKAANTRWRSAARRAQRYDDEGKAGKQVRRPHLAGEQRERVQKAGADRRLSSIYRNGAVMRVSASMRVGTPGKRGEKFRERDLPSGGPGQPVSAEMLDPVIRALEAGDDDDAAASALAAFFESYGLNPDMVEVEHVSSLSIEPDDGA